MTPSDLKYSVLSTKLTKVTSVSLEAKVEESNTTVLYFKASIVTTDLPKATSAVFRLRFGSQIWCFIHRIAEDHIRSFEAKVRESNTTPLDPKFTVLFTDLLSVTSAALKLRFGNRP